MKTVHLLSAKFDPQRLQAELEHARQQWIMHFNTGYYQGEWSGIALRSPAESLHGLGAGDPGTTQFRDTELLNGLPYTRSVIDSFNTRKHAVRYLKLTAGSEIKAHRDRDLVYWDGFVRLHVPVQTNEQVECRVGNETVTMRAGECWFADFSQVHSVHNNGTTDRVHLVIDLEVNGWMRHLFEEEGIVKQGEGRPDPMDAYSKQDKLGMIDNLIRMNNPDSLKVARDIAEKYVLTVNIPGN